MKMTSLLLKHIRMKKSIGVLIGSFFLTGFLFTSCSSPAEKVENAEENVTEAKLELEELNADYSQDMVEFKERKANQIADNEKSIQDFNARIANEKSDAKAAYQQEIADLNNKNSDMKKKMEDFKADSKTSWEAFETEFERDMDELGTAFRDFTVSSDK
jgi:predicted  nucleic acid-binding Zn-ribbon protein